MVGRMRSNLPWRKSFLQDSICPTMCCIVISIACEKGVTVKVKT